MVYDCITSQLSVLNETKHRKKSVSAAEINDMKLKIKETEKAEKQLIDTMLSGGFNEDLLKLANEKASQLKRDKAVLYKRLEELKSRETETEIAVNLAKTWKNADYSRKKEVVMLMIHRIVISENGNTKVIWNL